MKKTIFVHYILTLQNLHTMEGLLIFLGFILIILSIPITVAGIAYLMRKSKRNAVEQTMPSNVIYKAPVRINTPKKNDQVMKFTGFEFSGVLYVVDNIIHIQGHKEGQHYQFNIKTCDIKWVGTQMQNGLIQWFTLRDEMGVMIYVNVETGLFVFRLGNSFPSTQDVYKILFEMQQKNKTS